MSGNPRAPRPAGGAAGNAQAPRSAGKPRPKAPGAGGGARYEAADTGATAGGGDQQQGPQKIDEVNTKLASVRTVMTNNMQMALDRGERLETIEAKSDTLLEDSNKFQTQAAATKHMFCRRHWRNVLIVSIIASVLLALIIWWAS